MVPPPPPFIRPGWQARLGLLAVKQTCPTVAHSQGVRGMPMAVGVSLRRQALRHDRLGIRPSHFREGRGTRVRPGRRRVACIACCSPPWGPRFLHEGVGAGQSEAGRSLRDQIFFFLLRTALKERPKGPPTANRQLPSTANRHQPPTTNRHQPPAANRRQPPAATNR